MFETSDKNAPIKISLIKQEHFSCTTMNRKESTMFYVDFLNKYESVILTFLPSLGGIIS